MRATTRHQRKCRALSRSVCEVPFRLLVPRPRGSPPSARLLAHHDALRTRPEPPLTRTPRRVRPAVDEPRILDRSPSRDRACINSHGGSPAVHITCFADHESAARDRASLTIPPLVPFPRRACFRTDDMDPTAMMNPMGFGPAWSVGWAPASARDRAAWLRHGKSFPRRAPARPPLQRRGVRHPRVLPGSGPRGRPHRASRRAHHGRGVRPVRQPHAGARRDPARSLPSLPSVIRSRRSGRDGTTVWGDSILESSWIAQKKKNDSSPRRPLPPFFLSRRWTSRFRRTRGPMGRLHRGVSQQAGLLPRRGAGGEQPAPGWVCVGDNSGAPLPHSGAGAPPLPHGGLPARARGRSRTPACSRCAACRSARRRTTSRGSSTTRISAASPLSTTRFTS